MVTMQVHGQKDVKGAHGCMHNVVRSAMRTAWAAAGRGSARTIGAHKRAGCAIRDDDLSCFLCNRSGSTVSYSCKPPAMVEI